MRIRPGFYACGCRVHGNGVVDMCGFGKTIMVPDKFDLEGQMAHLEAHFYYQEFAPLDQNPESETLG